MKKKLKVLLLFDSPEFQPRGYNFKKEFRDPGWNTEPGVYRALCENDYDVSLLGLHDDISILTEEVKHNRPDVIFNLAEVFNEKSYLEKNIASVLEMFEIPYTGCSSASLHICNNKALSKKILSHHNINIPKFSTFKRNNNICLPKNLCFPIIIKPLNEEASRGISRKSVVNNKNSFVKRIDFIHNNLKTDAIAEEYIEGREIYTGMLGNRPSHILPPREMHFGKLSKAKNNLATYKIKWDKPYRKKQGIMDIFAKTTEASSKKIKSICMNAYRALEINSYVRFDMKIATDSTVYILEANANPCLARNEVMAQSAKKIGISYNEMIRKIVNLSLRKG